MTMQEQLIRIGSETIAQRLAPKDSLQERVVNLDVEVGKFAVKFLNKDGSYFTEMWQYQLDDVNNVMYTNSMMNEDIKEIL